MARFVAVRRRNIGSDHIFRKPLTKATFWYQHYSIIRTSSSTKIFLRLRMLPHQPPSTTMLPWVVSFTKFGSTPATLGVVLKFLGALREGSFFIQLIVGQLKDGRQSEQF